MLISNKVIHSAIAVLVSSLLVACASDPNTIYFGLSPVSLKVEQVAPKQYMVTARGAGAHSAEQVASAFAQRAAQLCAGLEAVHEATTTPFTYNSSGGGYFFTHKAFSSTGLVTCK